MKTIPTPRLAGLLREFPTMPGSLTKLSFLRSGQSVQPFVRGVEVNAQRSLPFRHAPPVGDDRVTFGRHCRINEDLIPEFRAYCFAPRIPLHPQSRLAHGIQPKCRLRRETVLLRDLPQHRLIFGQNGFADYRRQQAMQPCLEAQVRFVTPEDARRENNRINHRQFHPLTWRKASLTMPSV